MYLNIKKNKNIIFDHSHSVSETNQPLTKSMLLQLEMYKTENYYKLIKILEPYGFLYSTTHLCDFSISHIVKDRLFFEFFEIFVNVQLNETTNVFSTNDIFLDFLTYKSFKYTFDEKCNLCFFDIHMTKKEIITSIVKKQSDNGTSIIKAFCNNQTTELVYFLSTMYDVILFRPKITIDNYVFIICQNYQNTYLEINDDINLYDKIPLYIMNNINEFYTIIQQRVLYLQSQIVFYSLHENNEKIKEIKNKNISNTIKWCELYGIPYNNIKINIFSDEIKLI